MTDNKLVENETKPIVNDASELRDVVKIVYATADNAVFGAMNGFLTLDIELTGEEADSKPEKKHYDRVFLHRAFPFDQPFSYISVLDPDSVEIALIRSIEDFDKDMQKMIMDELERKYYAPVIQKIHAVKERYGFSYWEVTSDSGELRFTLKDTYRNIHRVGNRRVFIMDVDGNRYEIPDIEALDIKSYKKIELYL